jgi:hypothetical protein
LPELSLTFILLFFTIKLGAALFFLYVYTYHYGGGELTADAGRFYEEAKILQGLFFEHPKLYFQFLFNWNVNQELIDTYLEATSHWNASGRIIPNDSRNVIRVNSVLLFISNGNIFIHFIFFSLITFLAGLDFAQFIRKHSDFRIAWIIVGLTLTPSIAFWGSSIIKEPLMITGLFLLLRGIFDTLTTKQRLIRILLGLIGMSLFKPYVLFILLSFLILYILFRLLPKTSRLLITAIYFVVLFLIGELTNMNERVVYSISKQQEDFINLRDGGLYLIDDDIHYIYIYYANRNKFSFNDGYATLKEPTGAFYMRANENFQRQTIELSEVGKTWKIGVSLEETASGIPATPIDQSRMQMVKNIPDALINTLVRPFPWDPGSWLKYLATIENIVLLILLVLAIIYRKAIPEQRMKDALSVMILFGISTALIVGWTTPVLGAIVRYKVPATVIMVILILVLSKTTKNTKLTKVLCLFNA